MVTFKTKIGLLPHLPGMHYLEIPAHIIKKLGGKFSQRLICEVDAKLKFNAGLVALGQGKGYLSISKKRLQLIGKKKGDAVMVSLTPDRSRFGMKMPVELKIIFDQDPQAQLRFEKLTPGKQRYILYYIGLIKSPDLRIDRAVTLMQNLKKTTLGKETFRQILGKPVKLEDF